MLNQYVRWSWLCLEGISLVSSKIARELVGAIERVRRNRTQREVEKSIAQVMPPVTRHIDTPKPASIRKT